jgi:FkbM family methyltransferase
MLNRYKLAGLRILRDLASVPLWTLGKAQRGLALQKLTASMFSDIEGPGGTIRFITPTPLLQARADSSLSKEPDTIEWIESFEPEDIFWDVGANVGVFSLYAAMRCGVRVLAFEPFADNYMVLCKNIDINSLGDRIIPYCIALAGNTELGLLNLASRDMGAALHQFGRRGETSRYWTGETSTFAQGMLGYAIDDFIRQFQPPFPTHLKLDVDGLESQILQGARHMLRDPRLRSIMVELSLSDGTERDYSMAWLSDAGFELVRQGQTQEAGDQSAANHFFARRQAASSFETQGAQSSASGSAQHFNA